MVNELSLVNLSGSGSDPDGSIVNYTWTQVAGTAVALINADSANASFTAINVDSDTLLTFQLTVTDNDGAVATDTMNVTVQNVNQLPSADAGTDQTVTEGDIVTLDASTSTDPDGSIISYNWTQTGGPEVVISNANSVTATFTAPQLVTQAVLTFELSVIDNDNGSASDTVSITVQNANQLPVADAGADQVIGDHHGHGHGYTTVYLDGTASYDLDGSIASYSWTQTEGPAVSLSGANTATPSFTSPNVSSDTVLVFQLTVTDNGGATAEDGVNITIQDTGMGGGGGHMGYYLTPDQGSAYAAADTGNVLAVAMTGSMAGDTAQHKSSAQGATTPQRALLIVQKQGDVHVHVQDHGHEQAIDHAQEHADDHSHNYDKAYDVYRYGPETGFAWQQTAEDPNSYDRPDTVYYVSEGEISVWKSRNKVGGNSSATGQPVQHQRLPLDTRELLAAFGASQNKTQVGGFIKVSHGTTTSPVNIDSEVWSYRYDANGNLEDIINSAGDSVYTYDALNRLIEETRPGLSTETIDYDRNGNRTTLTVDTTVDTWGYLPNSNQLNSDPLGSIAHDAAGNRTSDRGGNRTFTYNDAGRLYQVFEGGQLIATYIYNAQGQRTRKITATDTTVYHYDLAGNLISETTEAGVAIRDYVYIGSVPVAQIDTDGVTDTVNYLHADHLGTPRRATNAAGDVVWNWESDAFGTTAANDDPDNDGTATIINLRFPGQYYDAESGLHYNYFRYYDPSTGRYVTSDPIGLEGGINTFVYVYSNPMNLADPFGLIPTCYKGVPTVKTTIDKEKWEKDLLVIKMLHPENYRPADYGSSAPWGSARTGPVGIDVQVDWYMWEHAFKQTTVYEVTTTVITRHIWCEEKRPPCGELFEFDYEDKPKKTVTKKEIDQYTRWSHRKLYKAGTNSLPLP